MAERTCAVLIGRAFWAPLDFSRLRAKRFVDAMIRSFHGSPDALESQLLQLLKL